MPTPDLPLIELTRRYLAYQESLGRSDKTLKHYVNTFRDFTRFLHETNRSATGATLTTATFQAFQRWLKETPVRPWRGQTRRAPQGVHGRMKDMRAFVRWLAAEELIVHKVTVPVPTLQPTMFQIFTDEELGQLWSCRHLSGQGEQAVRNRALVGLMLDSGLRLAEVAGLQLGDLYLDDKLVHVRGKGGKERFVPFSTAVSELLREWLTVRGRESGDLFWLSDHGVRMLFYRISQETGLHVHAHKFRHTSCTKMVRANMDLHSVRRIMGHASLDTTEIYLSLSNQDLKDKHAAASPFEETLGTRPTINRKKKVRRRLRLIEGGQRRTG